MTIDKQKLKALAEAANAITTDVNITMAIGADPVEVKAVQDYLQVAMPKTILALLTEIEQLRKAHEQVCTNYNRVSFASEERGKQIDQLKAENEILRKDAERYRFLRDAEALAGGLAILPVGKWVKPAMLCTTPFDSAEMTDSVVDDAMAKAVSHD
ncbi:hypothetical protein ACFW6U_09930 [Pseudomonas guariconensis]|uniref:hypothetical protein n=1 Tax=Pseudomonas guariconensis TaxID=1288410 RepID=UPI0036730FC6